MERVLAVSRFCRHLQRLLETRRHQDKNSEYQRTYDGIGGTASSVTGLEVSIEARNSSLGTTNPPADIADFDFRFLI